VGAEFSIARTVSHELFGLRDGADMVADEEVCLRCEILVSRVRVQGKIGHKILPRRIFLDSEGFKRTTSRFFVHLGIMLIQSLFFPRSRRPPRVGVTTDVVDEVECLRDLALTALSCSRSSATVDGPLRILSVLGLDLADSGGAASRSDSFLGRVGGDGVATALTWANSKGLISCFFSSGCSSVSLSSRPSRRQRLSLGRGVGC